MLDNGYVYVLINPSMPGLVKIGKTTRDVEERAKELTASTGVPTPFTVVYDAYFDNCSKAEEFVHTFLEKKGYRVSSNREFFEISIKDAIDSIMVAKNHLSTDEVNNNDVNTENANEHKQQTYYDDVVKIAKDYYFGNDDKPVDMDKALKYYLKAIKLGSIESLEKVAFIYRSKGNLDKALKYFIMAVEKGLIRNYIEIAHIYYSKGDAFNYFKTYKSYLNKIVLKDDMSNLDDFLSAAQLFFAFEHGFNKKVYLYDKESIYKLKKIILSKLTTIENFYNNEFNKGNLDENELNEKLGHLYRDIDEDKVNLYLDKRIKNDDRSAYLEVCKNLIATYDINNITDILKNLQYYFIGKNSEEEVKIKVNPTSFLFSEAPIIINILDLISENEDILFDIETVGLDYVSLFSNLNDYNEFIEFFYDFRNRAKGLCEFMIGVNSGKLDPLTQIIVEESKEKANFIIDTYSYLLQKDITTE